MYNNFRELLAYCEDNGCPISEAVMRNETKLTSAPRQQVRDGLSNMFRVMKDSASRALGKPLSFGFSLIAGLAQRQNAYANGSKTLCGAMINRLMARALSCSETNASMGRICAAPTAGSCGILPAVLITLGEQLDASEDKLLDALAAASGVGAIIVKNATVAGAEGGCQAECGVAAAMAAAGAVEMAGGSPRQAIDAAAFTLQNVMGLVCDPVAGLVQVPCALRNASQSVNALLCADLALGGMTSLIPMDEVVAAMYSVGRMLPMQLRETALGGIAATPTAKAIHVKKDPEG